MLTEEKKGKGRGEGEKLRNREQTREEAEKKRKGGEILLFRLFAGVGYMWRTMFLGILRGFLSRDRSCIWLQEHCYCLYGEIDDKEGGASTTQTYLGSGASKLGWLLLET